MGSASSTLAALSSRAEQDLAVALNDYSACLAQLPGRAGEAIVTMINALSLHYTPDRLLNVGLVAHKHDLTASFRLSSAVIAAQQKERHLAWRRSLSS